MEIVFTHNKICLVKPANNLVAGKWQPDLGSLLKIVFFVCLILVSFFSNAQNTTINVGGTNRNMIVYSPANLGQNRPLLISLHGLNQDPVYQQNQAKWELVADTAKFVVVYPEAINKSWDISGNRDIDFILAIITNMKTRFNIDLNRVYVSGFSMGGMMSYHVANKIADKVAAIAPVSGYLFANPVSSSRPLPIIHTHGTADDVVGYSGVAGVLEKWRNWNSCPSQGTLTKPYPANKPASQSSKTYWGPCAKATEMVLLTLDGKGHWHSNDENSIHTTREIWNFIRKFSLVEVASVSFTSPANNSTFTLGAPINLAVNATVSTGTIIDVKFYAGATLLNTDNQAPYTYNWTTATAGTHIIKAVATDNSGKTSEASITIKVNVPQGPYNGTWSLIPGTVQFENFDVGGNGFAYMDGTPGSAVTPVVNFRTDEDVDIENCTDVGRGYNLGYTTAGEWTEYSVDVQTPGEYSIALRVACNGDARTLSLAMDGVDIAKDVAIPNTTGWQVWQTVTVPNVSLKAGRQILRMTIGATDYINLNYVTFTLTKELKQEPYKGTAHSLPGRIEAEEYDLGGEGLAYHEANTNGNEGGATLRNDEVDIEPTTDAGGGYNIGYILQGEWLEYTVNVTTTGVYNLDLRMAADGGGKLMHVQVDGVNVSGPVNVPNTGGWQIWQTVTVPGIALSEGEHVIRLAFDSDYMNLNYMEFSDVVTSLTKSGGSALKIYPNPINHEGLTIEGKGSFTYTIRDVNSHIVDSGYGAEFKKVGAELAPGIYWIFIENEQEKFIGKIIK